MVMSFYYVDGGQHERHEKCSFHKRYFRSKIPVYMLQNYLNIHFLKLNYQNISTAAIIFFSITYILVALAFYLEKRAAERTWSNG
jgi:hypothetical protein